MNRLLKNGKCITDEWYNMQIMLQTETKLSFCMFCSGSKEGVQYVGKLGWVWRVWIIWGSGGLSVALWGPFSPPDGESVAMNQSTANTNFPQPDMHICGDKQDAVEKSLPDGEKVQSAMNQLRNKFDKLAFYL